MSRVGKKPIAVPSGVKVTINDRTVTIEGKKGTLSFEHRPEVAVAWDESEKNIVVTLPEAQAGKRQARALWGTSRAILQNMVTGVADGYKKQLEIVGVGWGAQIDGQKVKLNVGFASAIELNIPTGVSIDVKKQLVTLESADKQAVGQFAAQIRAVKKPEPYNGKGIKYADEVIRRKQGKQFGA